MPNIVSTYLTNKLLYADHPLVEHDHCSNRKQRRKICAVCSDVCGRNVMKQEKQIQWDDCVNCNICTVACPTRAIRSSADNMKKILEMYSAQSDMATIACRHNTDSAILQLYCVASVSWEMLAYLALKKKVVLLKGNCESCPDRACLDVLDTTLGRAENFLGATLFQEKITITQSTPERQLSRRELFSLFAGKMRGAAKTVLPQDDSIKPDGILYRRILTNHLAALEKSGEMRVVNWYTPVFTQSCDGCVVCTRVCPRQAISVEENGGEKSMRHSVWKCGHCGACEAVCMKGGIAGYRVYQTASPLQPVLTKLV